MPRRKRFVVRPAGSCSPVLQAEYGWVPQMCQQKLAPRQLEMLKVKLRAQAQRMAFAAEGQAADAEQGRIKVSLGVFQAYGRQLNIRVEATTAVPSAWPDTC